ncbi:MAG: YgiQ family radical SAM protein [Oscillospiraceae bacterium]|nr:YgiQ family radical SAM protein [Oscillospiraceae bacterium]
MREAFLPTTAADCLARGWDAPDFVFVSGDAYVDHPSFGAALLGRVLEKAGYRVAMLAQPDWRGPDGMCRFGRPRLGFLVSSGVIDSMVNHYTAAKKPRSQDAYAPGGRAGLRPDRAVIVYCNLIRRAFGDVPILIGGVEASLRRFSHYDYWDDRVRRSILADSGADLLLYGMGERTLPAAAKWLEKGAPADALPGLRGVCWMAKQAPADAVICPDHRACASDKAAYASAFMLQYAEQDPVRGKPLAQRQGEGRWLLQNPPDMPPTRAELDAAHALPFARAWHPDYDAAGGVPALEEVKFSLAATRGCFGGCSFCAITFHQGRIVTSRSPASLLQEARLLTHLPDFKGYIHDVGGPTANFRRPACADQLKRGACAHRQCLYPKPCPRLEVDHREFLRLLRDLRGLPGIKKVFVRSGLRYDYIQADPDGTFFRELCEHHISGQLKVAPEHVCPRVLSVMGKPGRDVYDAFVTRYEQLNRALGRPQYLVPYLMSGHPGSDLAAAVELALYLRDTGHQPEQVQDFYPTPGTLSTCMFHTGLDPRTMRPVYVPRTAHEKALQRALLQYRRPANHALAREALRLAGREDLIGFGRGCLVPPVGAAERKTDQKKAAPESVARHAKTSGSPSAPARDHGSRRATAGKASPRAKGKPGGKRR